jgi:hypothetical protein
VISRFAASSAALAIASFMFTSRALRAVIEEAADLTALLQIDIEQGWPG